MDRGRGGAADDDRARTASRRGTMSAVATALAGWALLRAVPGGTSGAGAWQGTPRTGTGATPGATPEASPEATPQDGLVLHVDLQEGFAGDRVVVRVGGRTVFDDAATTSLMRGKAASFAVPVAQPVVMVVVALPDRGTRGETEVDVRATPYLGVGLRGSEIIFRPTETPIPYM